MHMQDRPCFAVAASRPPHACCLASYLASTRPPACPLTPAFCPILSLPSLPSRQVASLKIELAALRSEQDIREEELLGQVAALQAALAKKKRRKSPGKMLKKAAEAIRHGLSSPVQAQEAPASPAQQQQQQQQQGAAAAPNGGELRRTWGSIKSKFSMSGRGSSKEEEAYAAAAGPASPTATAAAADSPRR